MTGVLVFEDKLWDLGTGDGIKGVRWILFQFPKSLQTLYKTQASDSSLPQTGKQNQADISNLEQHSLLETGIQQQLRGGFGRFPS